jgi:hypothetical protein
MSFFLAHHKKATYQVSYFKYINLHYSNIYDEYGDDDDDDDDDDDVNVTGKHLHERTKQKYQAAMIHN